MTNIVLIVTELEKSLLITFLSILDLAFNRRAI